MFDDLLRRQRTTLDAILPARTVQCSESACARVCIDCCLGPAARRRQDVQECVRTRPRPVAAGSTSNCDHAAPRHPPNDACRSVRHRRDDLVAAGAPVPGRVRDGGRQAGQRLRRCHEQRLRRPGRPQAVRCAPRRGPGKCNMEGVRAVSSTACIRRRPAPMRLPLPPHPAALTALPACLQVPLGAGVLPAEALPHRRPHGYRDVGPHE